jgi:hypothetical protein
LRLFLGGIGDVDAALGLLFLLDALDQDAVMQRTHLHRDSSYVVFGSFVSRPTGLTFPFKNPSR